MNKNTNETYSVGMNKININHLIRLSDDLAKINLCLLPSLISSYVEFDNVIKHIRPLPREISKNQVRE